MTKKTQHLPAGRGGGFDHGVLPVRAPSPMRKARPTRTLRTCPIWASRSRPLAPPRFPFRADEPGSHHQPVVAGRTSRDHRSQSRPQDAAGSVQRRLTTWSSMAPTRAAHPEPVRSHLRHLGKPAGEEAGGADPQHLQRHRIRSLRHAFLPGRRSSGDDIHTVTLGSNGGWAEEQPPSPALTMGHAAGNGLEDIANAGGTGPVNAQVGVDPCAAGLALSNDGKTLVVANYYNDSITVFTGGLGNWSKGIELDLRPGKSNAWQSGVPGGEDPFWVVVKGNAPGRHRLCIQHSRPRDRCSEPGWRDNTYG